MRTRRCDRPDRRSASANARRLRTAALALLAASAVGAGAQANEAAVGTIGSATAPITDPLDPIIEPVCGGVERLGIGPVARLGAPVSGALGCETATDVPTTPPRTSERTSAPRTVAGSGIRTGVRVADPAKPATSPAGRPDGNANPDQRSIERPPTLTGRAVSAARFPLMFLAGMLAGVLALLYFWRRDIERTAAVERMKTEILSNISHELRTPLTPVRGYAEILRTRRVPQERVREFAQAIIDAAEQLEGVVNVLVSYAAIEGGRFELRRGPRDVREMLTGLAGRWQRRAQSHVVSLQVPEPLPAALLDARLMTLAVDQLVDNAVKFSPEGGIVTIRACVVSDRLDITVADQGSGIERDHLDRLFGAFHQGDGSATRRVGGLGLGLSLVDRIARLHGGEVRVQTAPGRGSAFTISVPLRVARSAGRDAPIAGRRPLAGSRR